MTKEWEDINGTDDYLMKLGDLIDWSETEEELEEDGVTSKYKGGE